MKLEMLFSRDAIAERVMELGACLNEDYRGRDAVFVCVLKGAFMFFSDLVRHIRVQPVLDFIRVASYGAGDASTGLISFTKDVEVHIVGKHVLLVEDIVDTGRTAAFLRRRFQEGGAADVRMAALLDKRERRHISQEPDYAGFTVNEGFIVGYGLDYAEKYRELPALYRLER